MRKSERIYNFHELLLVSFSSQAIVTFCFMLTAISLAGNRWAGFMGFLTGIIYAIFTGMSYHGIIKRPSRMKYGGVLGSCFVLVFISLESSIFWGQYANCSSLPSPDSNASQRYMLNGRGQTNRQLRKANTADCSNRPGMRLACAFSVLMFLNYLFFILILLRFKDDILSNLSEEYLSVPTSESPVSAKDTSTGKMESVGGGKSATSPMKSNGGAPPSADL